MYFNISKPYVIAEIGSNHNGDMTLAKQLIDAAKQSGADCVKFQSWTADTIFSKKNYDDNFFLNDDYRNRTDYTLKEIVEEYSVSETELKELYDYALKSGIDCTSTPFSNREVDFLVNELNVNFIKVASMDLNNYDFLRYIARTQKPVLLSTGLASLAEIDQAVQAIEEEGNSDIAIMHCVSLYPPEDEQLNLHNICTLKQNYGYPTGFSDHTLGTSHALAAVALGALVIEKHFTLDKDMVGWDHKISSDPEDMSYLTRELERVYKSLGSYRIQRVEGDERLDAFRRSLVATRDIAAGELITEEMLVAKRPGTGVSPEYKSLFIGKKASRAVAFDQLLSFDDI